MTRYLYANNATTTLAQSVSATTTIINVASGDGDLFPSPASGEAFAITFVDAATGLQNEIAYCTSRSGDALTITRGQEGKNAREWSAGDIVANYITAGVIESWLQEEDIAGLQEALGFTPVEQGGGTGQTAVKINFGEDSAYSGIMRVSIGGVDAGGLVSGTYGKSSTDYQMLGFYQQSTTGRPVAVFNNGTTTVYNGIANYTDVTTEESAREAADTSIQTNLTNFQTSQAATNAEFSSDISDCVSGIYGKSSTDYQMLGLYQQGTTGRPVAVFNNGTTTVYNGIANYTDVTTEASAREAADTSIQTNLTQAISNQSDVNSSVTTALAAKVGTNASNDGTNSPVSLFNYFISTGVPWISGPGFSTSLVKTAPADNYYQIVNLVTGEDHYLNVQDSSGSYRYAPSSSGTAGNGGYINTGGMMVQGFTESTLSPGNNTVSFPKAFSGTPVSVVATAYGEGDMDVATYDWSSTGCTVYTPTNTANVLPVSIMAIGPE